MVTKGCGRSSCLTPNCASNKGPLCTDVTAAAAAPHAVCVDASAPSSSRDALQRAIQLCRSGAPLCEPVMEDTVMDEDDTMSSAVIQDPDALLHDISSALEASDTPKAIEALTTALASPQTFATLFLSVIHILFILPPAHLIMIIYVGE